MKKILLSMALMAGFVWSESQAAVPVTFKTNVPVISVRNKTGATVAITLNYRRGTFVYNYGSNSLNVSNNGLMSTSTVITWQVNNVDQTYNLWNLCVKNPNGGPSLLPLKYLYQDIASNQGDTAYDLCKDASGNYYFTFSTTAAPAPTVIPAPKGSTGAHK